MERTWGGLQRLSRDELVAEYDREARGVDVWSVRFIREEIFRRDLERQNAHMERMTGWILGLTVFIALLTVINVVVVVISFRPGGSVLSIAPPIALQTPRFDGVSRAMPGPSPYEAHPCPRGS